jgi:hypothetical protein
MIRSNGLSSPEAADAILCASRAIPKVNRAGALSRTPARLYVRFCKVQRRVAASARMAALICSGSFGHAEQVRARSGSDGVCASGRASKAGRL